MKQIIFFAIGVVSIFVVACDQTDSVIPRDVEPGAQATSEGDLAQYTCPMHPHYISTDPNGTCPICGMDLVPVADDALAQSTGAIVIPSEMIQTMGIRTARAEVAEFGRSLRAFGVVETNERLENVSASRLEGWIEDLTVRAEGDTVRPGALLYKVYSPDLIAAQKDFLNSLEIGNQARIAAVRQRLRSLGMQPSVIDQIARTRTEIERVPVYAEAGGIVARLQVREGDYVRPGTAILRLQSYSEVWVMASIPENDLPLVDTGLPVRLSFPSAPEAPAEGTIDYTYPTIDPSTRTAQVRIEVDNAAGYLRPGAYADITLDLAGQARLSVPTEAILRDSRGSHVIVALGEGRFAGREVQAGVSANGRTEVLDGLTPGEFVVASGQFMLDSEVNLREGFSKLQASPAMAGGPETPLHRLPIDAKALEEINHFIDMALYFHEALVDNYRIDPYFVDPAIGLGETLRIRFADTKLVPILEDAETALRAAKDARNGEALSNELSRLLNALQPWLLEGAPAHYSNAGVTLFKDLESGRLWLEQATEPNNPYGEGAVELIDWPDPIEDTAKATLDRRAPIDPHAGHR
jgi:Cu(I)/Ag(I) efflux system membrane fusion protein